MSTADLASQIRAIRLIVFDFDGVFTDNAVYVASDGTETVRCWRGDGLGLRKLDRIGVSYMVLSTEENPVVTRRCEKLRIECVQGSPDKAADLERILAEREIVASQVAYVGNDINDSGPLKMVGLPIIVQDAHQDVSALGLYRTHTPGGYGAVREICDLFEQSFQARDPS